MKEVFFEASERFGADRVAYLDDACRDDAELRAEVEAFLTAAEHTKGILQTAEMVDERVTLAEHPGGHVGRYKLLEQIGEGGFGVVFMAEQQTPVVRRVALKIIKLGMDTRQVVARFEAERQALAMMDHPNVAKVFDGGATDTGRPYFVMELVKGTPITDYCDQNNLNIRQRLELFDQVCQAVQHAHQKGLIHRDLKPSNVLVSTQDDKPVAKVIDFGIAKATQARLTEKTLFTEFRQLIGTPEYMSPEQAEGGLDIDTRSDVYSLGVLLYELLAGSPPFDPRELRSKAFAEMQRIIREVQPPAPSTRLGATKDTLPSIAAHRAIEPRKLAALVRGELDWIVMKCLEKDRSRRYETANALAMDLSRYLSDQPVLACPPSVRYRFGKFARRHSAVIATAGTIVGILVLATAVSTWEAVRATRAEEVTLREAQTQKASDAVLRGILSQGKAVTVRELLIGASRQMDAGSLKEHPEIEAEVRRTIGDALWGNDDATAEANLRKSLALSQQVSGPDSAAIAESLTSLGDVLTEMPAKADEGFSMLRDALAMEHRLYGAEHPSMVRTMSEWGHMLLVYHRLTEAEPLVRQSLALRLKLFGEEGREVSRGYRDVALLLKFKGDPAQAEQLYRTALEIGIKAGSNDVDTDLSRSLLAEFLVLQKRPVEAAELYRQALANRRERDGETLEVAYTAKQLAGALCLAGKSSDADAYYREASSIYRKTPASTDAKRLNAAAWFLATCELPPARDGASAVRFAEQAVAATNRKLPLYVDTLAAAYAETGQFEKAISVEQEALAMVKDSKDELAARLKLYRSGSPYHQSTAPATTSPIATSQPH